MSIIRILSEAVANKIAAGEVVERPSSVVKELIENSIDAGARRIEVSVEAGGKRLIRVTDDGCGMSRDDALLAFERHATSKIQSAEDLVAISSLGFRGEALPSIAAVARVVLETRHASEPSGTRVEIAGGRLRDVKEMAWAGGTSLEVRDLFFNTPARRKFLKSESTELGHIATLATHYALAHPEKSFRLSSLTNEILSVAPVSGYRERVYQVLGGQLLDQLIEIGPVERRILQPLPADGSAGDETEEEAATLRLSGFVSRPEVQRLNRNNIYFFVNRRLVRDRLILHAIAEAYRNILPSGTFPVALIFLETPTWQVDVNVHPSKTEVRFRHSSFVHDFMRDAIRQGLVASRPIAAFPLSRAGRTEVADEEEVATEERLEKEALKPASHALPEARARTARTAASLNFELTPPQPRPETGFLSLEAAAVSLYAPPLLPQNAAVKSPAGPHARGTGELPEDLEPLGQVRESFIVAANSLGLWLIDQHVAHERILFERHVRMRQERKVEGQRLLLPVILELKPDQLAVYREIAEELAANGFEVEPFGQRTLAVKTAPADIPAADTERLLVEILDSLRREARALSIEDLRTKIAASVACHAAIKVNTPLDRGKMEWLLRELGRTVCPMTCPHGRPIVLKYSLEEIQKAFKRT
ncbi:MAG TPA: DNA mismatch repair endonuclease MutL [Terriglobia bacterium]|nr:DNA mismatch repair endonuclease MutL [Terriglobia bacterium]